MDNCFDFLAIMLFGGDPVYSKGWKVASENISFCEDVNWNTRDDLEACFKKYAYTFNETVLSADGKYLRKLKVSTAGILHFVKPLKESIDPHQNKGFLLQLNPKLNYFFGITDPNFEIASTNPSAVPYILQELGLSAGVQLLTLMVNTKYETMKIFTSETLNFDVKYMNLWKIYVAGCKASTSE